MRTLGPTVRDRCRICHFPVVALEGESHPVCRQCEMIATGEKYSDGSDPAEGLSRGEILYIGTRYISIKHARTQAAMIQAETAWRGVQMQQSLDV